MTPIIKPLSPRKAVEHPRYDEMLRIAASHFLATVPDIEGREIVCLLSFGTSEEIREKGIVLWDKVPHARDASARIDALARHLLAIKDYQLATKSDPLRQALTAADVPVEVIDALLSLSPLGIKSAPSPKSMVDGDHGLPANIWVSFQKRFPGVVVHNRKVAESPGFQKDLVQSVLDMTLDATRSLGLT